MSERICFVGLDIHARRTAGAAVHLGCGEVLGPKSRGRRCKRSIGCRACPGRCERPMKRARPIRMSSHDPGRAGKTDLPSGLTATAWAPVRSVPGASAHSPINAPRTCAHAGACQGAKVTGR